MTFIYIYIKRKICAQIGNTTKFSSNYPVNNKVRYAISTVGIVHQLRACLNEVKPEETKQHDNEELKMLLRISMR